QLPASTATKGAGRSREELAKAREALEQTNISVADAVDALQGQNGKTRAGFDDLVKASPPDRAQILKDLAAAWDDIQKAQAAGDVPGGAAAQGRFDLLQQRLAATNLQPADIEQALSLRQEKAREEK